MAHAAEPLLLLLGPPQWRAGPSAPVQALASERLAQLLLVLALRPTRGWPRPELAARLWPDLDAEAAARNLRKVLHRVRGDLGADWVRAEGTRLVLAVSNDLQAFEARWQHGDAAGALALVRGTLGEGVGGLQADEEMAAERSHWLGRWRSALARALPALPPEPARAALQRWLEHEPADEALRAELEQRLSAAAAPAAVPAGPAALGRETELDEAAAQLAAPGSALGLVGPGGIGKSTLARTLAQRLGGRVAWAGCQGLADAAAVTGAVLQALGQAPTQGVDPAAQAGAALAAGPLLLVLDALEDAAADAALPSLLQAWQHAAPSLRLLWVARQRVPTLPGAVLALGGLDTPAPEDPTGAVLRQAAVRLLLQEAQRAAPAFDGSGAPAALGRIARAVGGHPLALVLAGGWLALLPPEAVADEVEQGATLLDQPAAGLPEGSLGAMLDRSLALLGAQAGHALGRLAAFPGPFDAAGALAVAGAGLTVLGPLLRHGLVQSEGSRFALHALVARHAARRLAPSEQMAARQAHALWGAAAALRQARLHGAASATALAWAQAHAADLRAAWAGFCDAPQAVPNDDAPWAALAEAWVRRCDGGPEAAGAIADLATALQGAQPRLPWRLRALRARLLARSGRAPEALALGDAVMAAQGSDPRSVALAGLAVAQAVQLTGDWPRLTAALDAVSRAVTLAGLDDLQAELEVARFSQALQTATLPVAEAQGRRALAAARAVGGAPLLLTLVGLSYALRRQKRYAEAATVLQEAERAADTHALPALRLRVLGEQAAVHQAQGRPAETERLGQQLLHEAQALGDVNQQRAGWLIAGVAADDAGRPLEALQRLARALDLALGAGATSAALGVVNHAADACDHLGEASLAPRLRRLVDTHPATWSVHHDAGSPPPGADGLHVPDLAAVPGLLAAVLERSGLQGQ